MVFSALRDPISGLTHCIGIILAILGTILLIMRSLAPPDPWHLVTFSIFGGGMILLYTASTLYHWLPLSKAGILVLRRIDHSMIFFYIAATYTPICLIPLRGGWGWTLFGCVWALAFCGIVLKFLWLNAPRWLSTSFFLGMGWMIVIGAYPLVLNLPLGALLWLVAGGILYSIGALIYARKSPNPYPNFFGFHEIFHIFVMAGSFCHFMTMYKYI